uniref:Uncharacterized protein n=1 Tax=Ananas comosus var. bracteatus TaxID=296719 RepID=A0A6V7PRQ7_ANACO|nr:unnamed protein product [Ananas comosus var. bracteatus]
MIGTRRVICSVLAEGQGREGDFGGLSEPVDGAGAWVRDEPPNNSKLRIDKCSVIICEYGLNRITCAAGARLQVSTSNRRALRGEEKLHSHTETVCGATTSAPSEVLRRLVLRWSDHRQAKTD